MKKPTVKDPVTVTAATVDNSSPGSIADGLKEALEARRRGARPKVRDNDRKRKDNSGSKGHVYDVVCSENEKTVPRNPSGPTHGVGTNRTLPRRPNMENTDMNFRSLRTNSSSNSLILILILVSLNFESSFNFAFNFSH